MTKGLKIILKLEIPMMSQVMLGKPSNVDCSSQKNSITKWKQVTQDCGTQGEHSEPLSP